MGGNRKDKVETSKEQKKKKKYIRETLKAISEIDENIQHLFRPLTEKEEAKLGKLLEEMENCMPEPEDEFFLSKFLNLIGAASRGETIFGLKLEELKYDFGQFSFSLGMAYERLKSKGLL